MFARLILLAVVLSLNPVRAGAAETPAHDKEFWRAVAKNENKPPAGVQPRDLAPELVDDLASTDPELRDELAYGILTAWIYQGTLTAEEVRPLAHTLLANLRVGIGETGADGVFRRSYSALILVAVVARDNDHAFLAPEEFRALLDGALDYLIQEKDERGFDPQKGWMHSVAHTADLLKFLTRSPRLTPADQTRILDALRAKLQAASAVYTHTEDERLARVLISLARRDAPEKEALDSWVKAVTTDAKFPDHPTPESLILLANARHLLTSLWAEMSLDERPSTGLDFLRASVRDALRQTL